MKRNVLRYDDEMFRKVIIHFMYSIVFCNSRETVILVQILHFYTQTEESANHATIFLRFEKKIYLINIELFRKQQQKSKLSVALFSRHTRALFSSTFSSYEYSNERVASRSSLSSFWRCIGGKETAHVHEQRGSLRFGLSLVLTLLVRQLAQF